jgi:hypothetical protein
MKNRDCLEVYLISYKERPIITWNSQFQKRPWEFQEFPGILGNPRESKANNQTQLKSSSSTCAAGWIHRIPLMAYGMVEYKDEVLHAISMDTLVLTGRNTFLM